MIRFSKTQNSLYRMVHIALNRKFECTIYSSFTDLRWEEIFLFRLRESEKILCKYLSHCKCFCKIMGSAIKIGRRKLTNDMDFSPSANVCVWVCIREKRIHKRWWKCAKISGKSSTQIHCSIARHRQPSTHTHTWTHTKQTNRGQAVRWKIDKQIYHPHNSYAPMMGKLGGCFNFECGCVCVPFKKYLLPMEKHCAENSRCRWTLSSVQLPTRRFSSPLTNCS